MKAVLFDFNGTLFDDTPFHRIAWVNYMAHKFHVELREPELSRDFLGQNNDAIFDHYFHGDIDRETARSYAEEKESEYRCVAKADPDHMRLMDGAPELFEKLIARGIPFAIATASMLPNIDFYMHDLGLERYLPIERIVYDEGKLASKPAPDFYIEAAKRVDTPIGECIVVEDTPSGFEAAIAAGAGRIIAIDRSTPRAVIERYPQIYAIVHDFYGFERFI